MPMKTGVARVDIIDNPSRTESFNLSKSALILLQCHFFIALALFARDLSMVCLMTGSDFKTATDYCISFSKNGEFSS